MNEGIDWDAHAMGYRAGVAGHSAPGWICDCGQWKFAARDVPAARTGNNYEAAKRAYERHVRASA